MVLREDRNEPEALAADGRLVGGVGGGDGGDEGGESLGGEGSSDGFKLRRGGGVRVSVGELVEAREHAVLQVTCLGLLSGIGG